MYLDSIGPKPCRETGYVYRKVLICWECKRDFADVDADGNISTARQDRRRARDQQETLF